MRHILKLYIEMLGKVKALKTRLGREGEFTEAVEVIRIRHKAKRNLMRIIASEGW